eukprot:scaffold3857_cov127-Cylindrotheca_fusiformis.AAC.6
MAFSGRLDLTINQNDIIHIEQLFHSPQSTDGATDVVGVLVGEVLGVGKVGELLVSAVGATETVGTSDYRPSTLII